jgi:hypothetical protein
MICFISMRNLFLAKGRDRYKPIYQRNKNKIMTISGSYFGAIFSENRGQDSVSLRIDVDGDYPQNLASGSFNDNKDHWIADLRSSGTNTWTGTVTHYYSRSSADADPVLTTGPFDTVTIEAHGRRGISIQFLSGTTSIFRGSFTSLGKHFRTVNMEFDTVEGVRPVKSFDTRKNPGIQGRTIAGNPVLSIEDVFRKAGFQVEVSQGSGSVPVSRRSGGNSSSWSDQELHDAMQIHWSLFDNDAQDAFWFLFADDYDQGNVGVMFDLIGPNERQGAAIFNSKNFGLYPKRRPVPPIVTSENKAVSAVSRAVAESIKKINSVFDSVWQNRAKFYWACHEIGHIFNLAHSFEKKLGTPWQSTVDFEPESRSFMNYPKRVTGGEMSFFSSFEFRFSDNELRFLRHAPVEFTQPGHDDFGHNHAGDISSGELYSPFRLELRTHRSIPYFEFLELVNLELKLTNVSQEPQLISDCVLEDHHEMSVIIQKQGKETRQWQPYARHLFLPKKEVLMAGKSKYGSLGISSGLNGWNIAEPGVYLVKVALHIDGQAVVSNSLRIRIAPPKNRYDEELFAQDFFTDEVGRTLAFNGSKFFSKANDCLKEACDRFPENRLNSHARLALNTPISKEYKMLSFDRDEEGRISKKFVVSDIKADEAREGLNQALIENADTAVESLGHIDFKKQVDHYSTFLAENGDSAEAEKCQDFLYKRMKKRKVLDSVLDEIVDSKQKYGKMNEKSYKTGKTGNGKS